jgi:hypothetical protein
MWDSRFPRFDLNCMLYLRWQTPDLSLYTGRKPRLPQQNSKVLQTHPWNCCLNLVSGVQRGYRNCRRYYDMNLSYIRVVLKEPHFLHSVQDKTGIGHVSFSMSNRNNTNRNKINQQKQSLNNKQ